MTKKRIVIGGIYFPVTAALEYLVRAFKRRDDVEIITAGSYHGRNIPWAGVSILPENYIFKPDIIMPAMAIGTEVPISMLQSRLSGKIDLLLQVDAGLHFTGKLNDCINATFLTDPHVLRGFYDRVKPQYDFVFCSQTPYAHPNNDEYYVPYAADAEWHDYELQDKKYDVVLIGNAYANRVDLINTLNNMGVKTYFRLGIGKGDVRPILNQSVIGLNWSSLDDLTARVWETMATGIIPVINRVTDLQHFFREGEHYLGFQTKEEAIAQIMKVLANPGQYADIGMRARALVRDEHLWDHRVNTLLDIIWGK